jgi:hypothetical protein
MHATAQDGVGFLAFGGVANEIGKIGLHGRILGRVFCE